MGWKFLLKFFVYFSGLGFLNDTYSFLGAEILESMSFIRIFMMNEVAGQITDFWVCSQQSHLVMHLKHFGRKVRMANKGSSWHQQGH